MRAVSPSKPTCQNATQDSTARDADERGGDDLAGPRPQHAAEQPAISAPNVGRKTMAW